MHTNRPNPAPRVGTTVALVVLSCVAALVALFCALAAAVLGAATRLAPRGARGAPALARRAGRRHAR